MNVSRVKYSKQSKPCKQLWDPNPLPWGCMKGTALANDAEPTLPVLGASCLVFLHFPIRKNGKAALSYIPHNMEDWY